MYWRCISSASHRSHGGKKCLFGCLQTLGDPQVNCKMLKIAKITRHCDPLGQSHSATFQTEPTAACEKSNLGAEGGANASVGTPGAKATWLPSCPFWKPVSLGSGAQRLWGTQGAYAKQPRGPSIPSIRPCLDYGKWRATGSGPDAETRPRNG